MIYRDIAGSRFGKLVALYRDAATKKWVLQCDCGNMCSAALGNLCIGVIVSCGCRKKVHGYTTLHTQKSEYRTWASMLQRCENPRQKWYKNYGGRGIAVCERWHKFPNFIADLGPKPTLTHTLDRINNNGDYSPENCRWATRKEQAANRRPRAGYND